MRFLLRVRIALRLLRHVYCIRGANLECSRLVFQVASQTWTTEAGRLHWIMVRSWRFGPPRFVCHDWTICSASKQPLALQPQHSSASRDEIHEISGLKHSTAKILTIFAHHPSYSCEVLQEAQVFIAYWRVFFADLR